MNLQCYLIRPRGQCFPLVYTQISWVSLFRFLALLLNSTGERIRITYGTLRRWSSYGCGAIEGLLFNNSFMYRMTWVSACVPHIFQRHTSTANAPSSFSLLSSSNQNGAVAKRWVDGFRGIQCTEETRAILRVTENTNLSPFK